MSDIKIQLGNIFLIIHNFLCQCIVGNLILQNHYMFLTQFYKLKYSFCEICLSWNDGTLTSPDNYSYLLGILGTFEQIIATIQPAAYWRFPVLIFLSFLAYIFISLWYYLEMQTEIITRTNNWLETFNKLLCSNTVMSKIRKSVKLILRVTNQSYINAS